MWWLGARWCMRRRRFLAALGGSASLGLGGLLAYRASDTRSLSVPSVETYDAAFSLNHHGSHDRRVEPFESLDRDERRVVEAAVDGGYETDDPPSWLSDFRDRTDYVRDAGVPYRLSDDFPRVVVTADRYTGDPGELSVASSDQFGRSVARYAQDDQFLAKARAGSAVDRAPRRRLLAFFETYDAVRVGGSIYRFSVTQRDPGAPYTLSAERVSREALRDARTVALSELPGSVRERVREAIDGEEHREYGLLDPSRDVVSKLRTASALRVDGKSYGVDAWTLDHLPLSVSATVTEGGIGFKDPGRVALAVENTGSGPIELYGGSNGPFGSLRYRPVDGGRERFLYSTTDGSSSIWPSTSSYRGGSDDAIAAGEVQRVEFELGGDPVGVPPGRHFVHGSLNASSDHLGGDFPFRVELEIE